jgi:cytochrome c biogenesis protein CcmG/thiol:disulfide interchange protein DsbE
MPVWVISRRLKVIMKKIAVLILAGCLVLFITACGESPVASVGKPAPDFDTVDLEGKVWSLSKLKGKVVFVNFWATWCAPCREEMPSMQKLYEKMPKDKFEMLALFNNDKKPVAKNFVAKLGLTMPILSDEYNFAGTKYGLTGLPETFIVDKKGVIREKFIGPAQWDSPENIQMMTKYINE